MSTSYRVVGRGHRLTEAKIRKLAEENGGSVIKEDHVQAGLIVVQLGSGCIHIYRTGMTAWNSFERFGNNYAAADEWQDILASAGMLTLSEHEEGYFT